ncbi:hypothetical protein GH714_028439 [Hevea brasiliensis]|uniref:DUF676 domain-containing protein n=1 Tax=Hevea brasiliensis TaxID=3981 RepID=A0A6A6LNI8_HEVBR|nr:hypothetical protein GH714_028439 [Hevea brasiliensis]
MIRWWISALQLTELFVSVVVHVVYGLYIFSSAVAGDLSQTLNQWFCKPNMNIVVKEEEPRGTSKTTTNGDSLPPIVLVHGIFGFGKGDLGGLSYFAGAEKDDKVLVPDLGSLTSIYDRLARHYPEWDEDHPIHFVGHSAGAQVVRVLQQMLADKAFKGYENTSENWVLSLTSLSGAFNGTTRTYFDGMQPEDGRTMKPICLLQILRLGVIIYDWLDIRMLKDY